MKKLSRTEMKNLIGGYEAPVAGVCGGYCVGSVGEWVYAPENGTWQGCLSDIATYCRSGSGGCRTNCGTGGGSGGVA